MEDCYARLMRMVAEGKSDAEVAAATGWPQDACAMIREELQCADDVFVEEEVA
jgi:uncharacterized membrane protein